MVIIYDNIPIMSNEVRAFLQDANDCKNYQQLQELWMKGGLHLRKLRELNFHSDGMNGRENPQHTSISNESNQSKLEKISHNHPSQENQINWTSIMDDVSDFEQDTLPDSSEDEQEEEEQINKVKAREQDQFQSLRSFNVAAHPEGSTTLNSAAAVLPSVYSHQQHYPASSLFFSSELTPPNSLPSSSLAYPPLNSQQLPSVYNIHSVDTFQKPQAAVATNNEQLHYPPSLLQQQQPIQGPIHQLEAKPKKKRKHVSDNTVIDPKIHPTKGEKKSKISNYQKNNGINTLLPPSQVPEKAIIQSENTTNLMQLILPAFSENTIVNQQKDSSFSSKPDVTVARVNPNPNPNDGANAIQGKIMYDEFTLDFTKLFNQESNMGNPIPDIRKEENEVLGEGNSNISFHSPNSSSGGLFASVMMNALQK